MVVDDLYIRWANVGPNEAQSPLLIDPNAVLALTITSKSLKAVARRDAHKIQACSGIQLCQFASCNLFDVREVPYALSRIK